MHETEKRGPLGQSVIDDRNERPLMIALTAIVLVWAIGVCAYLAWADLGADFAQSSGGGAAVTLLIGR
jgi:hypothetical protein